MKLLLVTLNTITLAAVLIVNYMASAGKINNTTVGEISRRYETLFTPAGYAFSIWGIIYLALIAFVLFTWYALVKKNYDDIIIKCGWFFIISNLANISWIYLWVSDNIGGSVIAILIILISLIILMFRLQLEVTDPPVRIIMFVWWPFAIYLGWIISASVANISAYFISIGWSGEPLSPQLWSITMITAAAAIYLFLIINRNLREAAAVGIWAFIAIAVKQWDNNFEISLTAIILSALLLGVILYKVYLNRATLPFVKLKRGEF
jgi:hypothetical protein